MLPLRKTQKKHPGDLPPKVSDLPLYPRLTYLQTTAEWITYSPAGWLPVHRNLLRALRNEHGKPLFFYKRDVILHYASAICYGPVSFCLSISSRYDTIR